MKDVLISLLFSLVLFSSIVVADGDMMGSTSGQGMMGSMGSGMFVMDVIGLLYFVIASVIFSVIFWLTYKLMAKDKKIE